MKNIGKIIEKHGVSQRQLAARAKLSFRTIQLLESGRHDAKLSTLSALAGALGYAPGLIQHRIEAVFAQPAESVAMISERLLLEGEKKWMHLLFEFVDAFRLNRDARYVEAAPMQGLSKKISALIASTVEATCAELRMTPPLWCTTVPSLAAPWFVSGIENLKAAALVESPVWFRRRTIFVLENFLSRR